MSQQINLFNPIFMKQKKYFSALTMLQALGLIILGSALFYGYALYQVRELSRQTAETAKQYTLAQNQLLRYSAEFSPEQSRLQLESELKRLEAKAAEQQRLVETLKNGAFGNTAGYSGYMRAFARQVVSGLWLTGFDIEGDGQRISLSGGSLDPGAVPAYIQRLKREKVMRGKSFAVLQMQQPKTEHDQKSRYIEFALQSQAADEAGQ